MLKVRNLSYAFGRHWALKNISFDLAKGDFLFLTGPSGAGKTTLLHLLHGALPMQRGKAEVAGYDLNALNPGRTAMLRREVSVVFQDFKILPKRSVAANVALALEVRGMSRTLIRKRVRAVVRSLGLERKSETPCAELSGGEKQRVAIARAVVVNPKLLLADEPTGNLDRELAFRLMAVFRQFHIHGTTIVLATHNRELLTSMPQAKILCLRDGVVDPEYCTPVVCRIKPRESVHSKIDETAQQPLQHGHGPGEG